MAKVGRLRIDEDSLQLGAGQRNFLQTLHLRHQSRHVLEARLANFVAQCQKRVVGMAGGYGRGPRHRPVQTLLYTREQPLFLGGNRVVVLVRSHELADYSEGTRETSAQRRHGRSLHTCYADLWVKILVPSPSSGQCKPAAGWPIACRTEPSSSSAVFDGERGMTLTS